VLYSEPMAQIASSESNEMAQRPNAVAELFVWFERSFLGDRPILKTRNG
jgi:hypothetical protein